MADISNPELKSQIESALGVKDKGMIGVTGIGKGTVADLSSNFFNFMLVLVFIILGVVIAFLVEAISQFNDVSSKPSQGCPYATCQNGATQSTKNTGVPLICVDPNCQETTLPMKAIGFN